MKHIILFLVILFHISCSTNSTPTDTEEQNHTIEPQIAIENNTDKTDFSNHYTKLDTVFIKNERGELFYEKAVYNQIIDQHPEFFQEYPDNPELSYYLNYDFEHFGSEVGQDNYYILYAYFLKKKNGEKELEKERKKLIEIYTNINSIFQQLQYGGTYFGHQYSRILGFAEFSLYLMPKEKNEFQKTYPITKQKELYITSLRQLVKDEMSIDFVTTNKADKQERLQKLNETINTIEKLITTIFYLKRAQEFQYQSYEYY